MAIRLERKSINSVQVKMDIPGGWPVATFIPLTEAVFDQLSINSRRKRRKQVKRKEKGQGIQVNEEKGKIGKQVKDGFSLHKLISLLPGNCSLSCWPLKSGEYLSTVKTKDRSLY